MFLFVVMTVSHSMIIHHIRFKNFRVKLIERYLHLFSPLKKSKLISLQYFLIDDKLKKKFVVVVVVRKKNQKLV